MHLTGGQYKGNKIDVPNGVKPTLSKVRESVFNVLNSMFKDTSELSFFDMFAGSGLMGLEAVSRNYNVLSVEKNSKNFNVIKNNYLKLKLKPNIILADSVKYLQKSPDLFFDVIYIDPPWTDLSFKYSYEEILNIAFSHSKGNGIIILEHEKIKKLSRQETEIFNEKLVREKVYGRCKLSFYKNQN